MFNQYIIYNIRAEIQGTGQLIIVSWFEQEAQLRQTVRAVGLPVSLKILLSFKVTPGHSDLHRWVGHM